jgi:hypothetical protein
MRQRELKLKNYVPYIRWLSNRHPNHRYFIYWYEVFDGSAPTRRLRVADKENIIEKLERVIRRVRNMTDDEYDAVMESGECVLCLYWHEQETEETIIIREYLFGGLRVIDRLEENEDGELADLISIIQEQQEDGTWLDVYSLTEESECDC